MRVTANNFSVTPSAGSFLYAAVQLGAAWVLLAVGVVGFHTFQSARAGNAWLNERAAQNMARFDRWLHG